jgi:hypothetical protein
MRCEHHVDVLRRANITVEANRNPADDQELDICPIELLEDSPDIELRHGADDVLPQPVGP